MMANKLELFAEFCPLILFPYLVLTFFVLGDFFYQKYQVRIRIRNVPPFTIFDLDLDKVKKNLKIESMVYNFILVLIMIELFAIVFWGISRFINSGSILPDKSLVVLGNHFENLTLLNQTIQIHRTLLLANNLFTSTLSLILPVSVSNRVEEGFHQFTIHHMGEEIRCVYLSSVDCHVSSVFFF